MHLLCRSALRLHVVGTIYLQPVPVTKTLRVVARPMGAQEMRARETPSQEIRA